MTGYCLPLNGLGGSREEVALSGGMLSKRSKILVIYAKFLDKLDAIIIIIIHLLGLAPAGYSTAPDNGPGGRLRGGASQGDCCRAVMLSYRLETAGLWRIVDTGKSTNDGILPTFPWPRRFKSVCSLVSRPRPGCFHHLLLTPPPGLVKP
jgi:hypothetical protein